MNTNLRFEAIAQSQSLVLPTNKYVTFNEQFNQYLSKTLHFDEAFQKQSPLLDAHKIKSSKKIQVGIFKMTKIAFERPY